MKQIFHAAPFVPTPFHTAEEKAWFVNYVFRFLEADCKASLFTQRFYQRLSDSFFHIAHYHRQGFYHVWFSSVSNQVQFLEHTLEHRAGGDPADTYGDVERAIQQHLRVSPLLERYRTRLKAETEARERALLEQLKRKYEPAFVSAQVPGPTGVPVLACQTDLFS